MHDEGSTPDYRILFFSLFLVHPLSSVRISRRTPMSSKEGSGAPWAGSTNGGGEFAEELKRAHEHQNSKMAAESATANTPAAAPTSAASSASEADIGGTPERPREAIVSVGVLADGSRGTSPAGSPAPQPSGYGEVDESATAGAGSKDSEDGMYFSFLQRTWGRIGGVLAFSSSNVRQLLDRVCCEYVGFCTRVCYDVNVLCDPPNYDNLSANADNDRPSSQAQATLRIMITGHTNCLKVCVNMHQIPRTVNAVSGMVWILTCPSNRGFF